MAKVGMERALFVVGLQNTGKSNQLRAMYRDARFHGNRLVPNGNQARELSPVIRLSNERSLYLRLSSPHEKGETLSEFLRQTEMRIVRWSPRRGRRWNFAGALQPRPAKRMPGATVAIAAFIRRFAPERTRVVFLSPDRNRKLENEDWLRNETRRLWALGVEVVRIDARSRTANGLLLADFFDFS